MADRRRRRKRGTANAQRYEQRLLDHLVDTTQPLQERSYAPSRSLCFVARQPKAREIHAADFSDRVVHHVLVPRLEALFEPIFIHDLYSNRVGKGTHASVARLARFMRAARTSARQPGWLLQLDIRKFFNSIDLAVLFGLVNRRLKKAVREGRITAPEARDLSWLTHLILRQDFKTETLYRCSPAELNRVPEYKRLTAAPPGKGLPIGNLSSQFFANVYLNALDQFVKHGLKCRYYLRYVDDLVLLDPDAERLRGWDQAIAAFLAERRQLELKSDRRLRPVTDGADFLGYTSARTIGWCAGVSSATCAPSWPSSSRRRSRRPASACRRGAGIGRAPCSPATWVISPMPMHGASCSPCSPATAGLAGSSVCTTAGWCRAGSLRG
jgi:hypothetical protein